MFRYISPAVALYTETASVYPEPPLWHPVALFAEREREREREREQILLNRLLMLRDLAQICRN